MFSIGIVTLYVRDVEEALQFYTEKLGFVKQMDASMGPDRRWVTISGPGQSDVQITLHRPASWHGADVAAEMEAQIGRNPSWVLNTSDCRQACETLRDRGVRIVQEPKDQPYGVEAVIQDLYGNSLVIVESK